MKQSKATKPTDQIFVGTKVPKRVRDVLAARAEKQGRSLSKLLSRALVEIAEQP